MHRLRSIFFPNSIPPFFFLRLCPMQGTTNETTCLLFFANIFFFLPTKFFFFLHSLRRRDGTGCADAIMGSGGSGLVCPIIPVLAYNLQTRIGRCRRGSRLRAPTRMQQKNGTLTPRNLMRLHKTRMRPRPTRSNFVLTKNKSAHAIRVRFARASFSWPLFPPFFHFGPSVARRLMGNLVRVT